MKTRSAAYAVFFALAAVARASAQEAQGPAAKATLADVAWIAGHWMGADGGNLSEEIWAPPEGDSMIGMWRYVSSGKARIFELLSITDDGTGPVMRLRHFDPKMVAREEKDRPVTLALVARKKDEATFEGPESSGAGNVRITYRRLSEKELAATLEKGGGKQEFRFRRKGP